LSWTRSLNTILEDELLSENEPEEPQAKTVASSELKFVDTLDDFNVSDSYQDSFEWDDYIGDELIGSVKNSEVSPRQSMDNLDGGIDIPLDMYISLAMSISSDVGLEIPF
jgi:hypothetical protein